MTADENTVLPEACRERHEEKQTALSAVYPHLSCNGDDDVHNDIPCKKRKHRRHKQRRLRTGVSLARDNRNRHFLIDFSFLQLLCAYQKPGQRVRLIQYSRYEQAQHSTHTPLRKPFHAYNITSLRTCRRNTPVTPCRALPVQTSRH